MRRAPFIVIGMLSLPLFFTAVAQAASPIPQSADGKLASAVQMRSGPGDEFPAVTRLAKNLNVDIHGCLKSWDWCDVSWRGNRGWVPAEAIDYRRGAERVSVREHGSELGVPEVTFQINSYWDDHYNNQLFYGDRERLRQNASFAR